MNDNNRSLLFKSRVFPGSVEEQALFWGKFFLNIGDIDRRALDCSFPDHSILVCFPRISYLAENGSYIYAIQCIRDILIERCNETDTPFYDDCDFFGSDAILKKEEERIRAFENQFNQNSNLIITSVQFWSLHLEANLSQFPNNQIPMSVSHALELLCMVQGGPKNLWGGGHHNHWFYCLGSPMSHGGAPCFDCFEDQALCITPLEYVQKPKEKGGAASFFVH